MHFVEILGSKSKQQNNKNFNEISLIFRHPSMPFTEKIFLFLVLLFKLSYGPRFYNNS